MEPEELKRWQQQERDLDKMYDYNARKLYDYALVEGPDAFQIDRPLHRFLRTDLLERLIAHFEETEEYEKCAYIVWIKKVTRNF
jgi:hypothetical protein